VKTQSAGRKDKDSKNSGGKNVDKAFLKKGPDIHLREGRDSGAKEEVRG